VFPIVDDDLFADTDGSSVNYTVWKIAPELNHRKFILRITGVGASGTNNPVKESGINR
jgi:hypothetical protein